MGELILMSQGVISGIYCLYYGVERLVEDSCSTDPTLTMMHSSPLETGFFPHKYNLLMLNAITQQNPPNK